MLEHKSFTLTEFKADGERKGEFTALVSVFGNTDRVGDVMVKGAFTRTLDEKGLPPLVWSHEWGVPPIGEVLKATQTDAGLEIKARLFVGDDEQHEVAQQVYTAMKAGVLKEFSFAYEPRVFEHGELDGKRVRYLKDVELFEVGPTLVGVNPATELHTVKSLLEKAGARNSRVDSERLQAMHDLTVENGAACSCEHEEEDNTSALVEDGKSEEKPSDKQTEDSRSEEEIERRKRAWDLLTARPR